MAMRYDALDQTGDDESPGLFPPDSASPLSAVSQATSTTMASPSPAPSASPLPFMSLAEQTFTPLSLDTSDFDATDKLDAAGKESGGRLLTTSKSMEHLRRTGNNSRSSSGSTAPASAGATVVSAMVESFEALHAKTSMASLGLGYELLRSKSAGARPDDLDLASPPSTLSPSPSFSHSPSLSPSHAVNAAPRRLDAPLTGDSLGAPNPKQTTPVAAQDESKETAPLTAAATSNPDPPPPNSNASQAHNATELPPSASSDNTETTPSSVVAHSPLVRPTPSSIPSQPRSRTVSNPARASMVQSSSTSLPLSHPTPDPNKLSQAGNFLGNIAALEATAERLSMTSSIEEAIREEHNELKRTESRRSSILRARAASTASETGSVYGQSQLSVASRQNSILGINTAARIGGYSPGGFVMSPNHSMSAASGRLRSGSKASSIGMPSHIPEDADVMSAAVGVEHAQEFRYLPRHGPGKASTRSVASKMSLAQIVELEHPTALTKEALDEADRAAEAGETPDLEDILRADAHQFIEAEFASDANAAHPVLGYGFHGESTPRLQLHQPDEYQPYGALRGDDDRPTTSGSGMTFEQAQAAFGDFDGVHCDPESGDFAPPTQPQVRDPPPRPRASYAPRPQTYVDPATGQQLLYYPAPVPAMLNLPPKLSKKPKDAAKNTRRSQVVSSLPKPGRESRFWLPDPTDGLHRSNEDAPFMGDLLGGAGGADADPPLQPSGMSNERPDHLLHARHPSETSTIRTIHAPPEQREIRRPQRLTETDHRKSRPITVDGLPPQLRASAFFELPPELPKIEIKDGSAMGTLDSLLDASAAAPVNAFTDHAFAGRLGAEVYGAEKKKKKKAEKAAAAAAAVASEAAATTPTEEKAKRRTLVKRNSSGNLLEPGADGKPKRNVLVKRNSSANLLDPNAEKKRASRFSLFGPKHTESDSDDDTRERPRSGRHSLDDDERSRGSASPDGLERDAGEDTDEDSDEEDGPVYQGPPTTLLAELQLRKQQNKQRTRPVHHYQEGMRSTLLELDAVAEVERKARHGKRVALAWEDPATVPRQEEEEDDDVPLGMLYVAKAAGAGNRSTMDISTLMSEVHRPLGLMERREIEENEPLSRRRDRLQGRVNEQMPTSLTMLQNRMSHMPPTPGGGPGMGMRSQSRLTLPLQPASGSRDGSSRPGSRAAGNAGGEESDPEIEGETLAARRARLAAENPLPRARPVSSTFSAELLKEFVPAEEEEAKNKASRPAHNRTTSRDTDASGGPANNDTHVPEEDETLGQRRRRLQREREAREREMAFSSLTRAATPNPAPAINNMPNSTIRAIRPSTSSMALGSHAVPGQTQPMPMPMSTSMADILNRQQTMTPAGMNNFMMDPREAERLRREAEAVRHQQEMEFKMAALRAQMPSSLTQPSVGARTGGYLGGRFNDGGGGTGAVSGLGAGGLIAPQLQQQPRASSFLGAPGMGMGGMGMGMGMGMMGGGGGVVGGYGGSTPNLGVYPNGMAASMGVNALPQMAQPYGLAMGVGPGVVGGQGHLDMVERWRQGVMP